MMQQLKSIYSKFTLFLLACILTSCQHTQNTIPVCKEFVYYPNSRIVSKSKMVIHCYYIENAPKDNQKLLAYSDSLVNRKMVFKLNETLERVTFLFFTDKGNNLLSEVNEKYHSDGGTVEDYNNPRRLEYNFSLDINNELKLTKIVYKNERGIIPPIEYMNSEIIEK